MTSPNYEYDLAFCSCLNATAVAECVDERKAFKRMCCALRNVILLNGRVNGDVHITFNLYCA